MRNGLVDLRFGRPLSGRVPTRFEHLGAADMVNSDYGALRQVFGDWARADDVLVEVGCGRGRVLNHWLQHRPGQRAIGIELDPGIGRQTAHRLRHQADCEVRVADATQWLPDDGTLFYAYNPFDREQVEAFADLLEARPVSTPALRLLYVNPRYVSVFEERPAWSVEIVGLQPTLWGTFDDLAVVEPAT